MNSQLVVDLSYRPTYVHLTYYVLVISYQAITLAVPFFLILYLCQPASSDGSAFLKYSGAMMAAIWLKRLKNGSRDMSTTDCKPETHALKTCDSLVLSLTASRT